MTEIEKAKGFTHDKKENLSIDWYTPKELFTDMAIEFDLDPCQPEEKIPWIPAKKHYWKKIDGLSQPWAGRVWLNPPYGKYTGDWLKKMHEHRDGMALVFSRTDCLWYHQYASKCDAILFLKGRVKFVDGLGVTGGGGAGCGSMLLAWGKDCVDSLKGMSHKGHLVINNSFKVA